MCGFRWRVVRLRVTMSLEKSVSPSALVSAVRRNHDYSYSLKVKLLNVREPGGTQAGIVLER